MKKKLLAILIMLGIVTTSFAGCGIFSGSNSGKKKDKHKYEDDYDDDDEDEEEDDDYDDDDDDVIDETTESSDIDTGKDYSTYEDGYLPYLNIAATSTDPVDTQIENKDAEQGNFRTDEEKFYSMDGQTLVGETGTEYVFENGEILWCKNDDHSDNYHKGTYKAYWGVDAAIYMVANKYLAVQSLTDYYDRNADSDFYIPKNHCAIVVTYTEKKINGVESPENENTVMTYYGYSDGEKFDLYAFMGDVSNGNYCPLTKK